MEFGLEFKFRFWSKVAARVKLPTRSVRSKSEAVRISAVSVFLLLENSALRFERGNVRQLCSMLDSPSRCLRCQFLCVFVVVVFSDFFSVASATPSSVRCVVDAAKWQK